MRKIARLLSIQLFVLLCSLPDAPRAEEDPSFSQRELDRMLAPIALYPDVVLSQVLMAATYPLEIVEAARWSGANPGLDGEAAVKAVADRDWDASVKALVAFPRLLGRMDKELEWTKRLGDAFLFQEAEVMETIQDLRQRAYDAGSLDSLDQARVIRDGDTIVIEPADPGVVYVPYYDTRVIYGGWWWPAYPPYYWAPPGYYAGAGFYWGSGVPYSSGLYFSYFNWPHRHVVIVKSSHAYRYKSGHGDGPGHAAQGGAYHWQHDPRHRRGVMYRDRGSSHKYGRPRASAGGEHAGVHEPDRPRGNTYRHGSHDGWTPAAGRGGGRAVFSGRNDPRRASAGTGRRPHGSRADGQRREMASAAQPAIPRAVNPNFRRDDTRNVSTVPPRAQAPRQAKGKYAGRRYDPPRASVTSPVYGSMPTPGASIHAPAFSGRRAFAR